MKHFLKIFLIVMLIGLIGCSPLESMVEDKPKLSLSEFKEKMESNEFVVIDASAQLVEQKQIEGAYIAQKDGYQIEFFDLNSSENAIGMFNYNKSLFEKEKEGGSLEFQTNGKNSSTYTLKTNGMFKYISRIDDTFLYLNVAVENEEEVKLILEGLGY